MTYSFAWHGRCCIFPAEIECVSCESRVENLNHNSFVCVTWLMHICDMTYSYAWSETLYGQGVRVMSHAWVMTRSCAGDDLFACVTWLLHTHVMTNSYAWHDLLIRVTWLIRMRDVTSSCAWHYLFVCVTWLIHICDTPYSYARTYFLNAWGVRVTSHTWAMSHAWVVSHT